MSYKLFDFSCINKKCSLYKYLREILVNSSDKPQCSLCNKKLDRQMPAPKGYVSAYEAFKARRNRKQ
jgi:hypothetical protein